MELHIQSELDAVAQAIRAGFVTSREISEHLGIGYQVTLKRINILIERGAVEPMRPPRSSKQSYRLRHRAGLMVSDAEWEPSPWTGFPSTLPVPCRRRTPAAPPDVR